EIIKQWWQVVASVISIILIVIFVSKGIGYAGKCKRAKKTTKKFENYYAAAATGLFGLAMTTWTAIACVLMVLAVLSLVFMLIEKNLFNKAEEALEDAKTDYERNKDSKRREYDDSRRDDDYRRRDEEDRRREEDYRRREEEYRRREEEMRQRDDDIKMLLMRMMGGNPNGGAQEMYMGGQGIGMEDIRGIISDTVTALIPGMQQALPQQASRSDELVEKLIEQNEMLMQQLAEQKNSERVVEREVAATSGLNEEMLKELIDQNNKNIQDMMEKNDERIEKLMDKVLELSANQPQQQAQVIEKEVPVERVVEKVVEVPVEKVVEKEVVKEVPVEKIVEREVIKEVKVKAEPKPKKEAQPRLTLDEAYELLSKQQKKYFDGLREYALSKPGAKEKTSTYAITIGQSTVNPLLKLTIKKDTTVALFKMEDEYLKDIKRDASGDGTKIKVKETEVIISDAQACKAAKNMIDLREDQIERYNDLLKEQRAMNRKK
ncbi:MAG: hypothetical protein K2M75_06670, partial [Clostridia bacterium]|nr:hypothetical protein [Clostridia bacterium]